MRKRILVAGIIVLIIAAIIYSQRVVLRDYVSSLSEEPLPAARTYEEAAEQAVVTISPTTPTTTSARTTTTTVRFPKLVTVPNALNLAVPFQSQAPFSDWSEPYENACEEASLIMVDRYLQGKTLSKQQMKDAIDSMVAWQMTNWKSHDNLPVEKVIELAKALYPGYTMQVLRGMTSETIKQQLVLGRPVIVPSAGRELGNPNFRGQGPLYHMLVIKGYTVDGKFITNDPGTRNGADYIYTSSVLMQAINDWGTTDLSGEKTGLVMFK